MKQPFAWDHYSDQPAIIRDRALKRQMRRSALPSLIKTFLIALITLPIAFLLTPFTRHRTINGKDFFGMGVNLDYEPNTTPYLIEELNIQKLLIRIPLWEMDRLHEYVAFIHSFSGKHITVALLQDREHITSPDMTRDHLIQIFEALEEVCETYVIGSTINRAKWGFFSVNEYLDFYAVAYDLKKTRGYGYLGTGYDGNFLKDMWKYDPSGDSWTQIVSVGGSKRNNASAFVSGNYAYVVCGVNNGSYITDFWKFDPSAGSWTELRAIANKSDDDYDDDYNIARANALALIIGDRIFITCGESGSLRSDTWEYYPSSDLWEETSSFEGTSRTGAVTIHTDSRAFVLTGRSSTFRFDDMWEFLPDQEYDTDY